MITKKEIIGKLLKKHPEVIQVFSKYGLKCIGCPMFDLESIEEAAQSHNIELQAFLADINKIIQGDEDAIE